MTSRRSNQRTPSGQQAQEHPPRPSSRQGEGRRSANEAGDSAVNAPKPGRAQKKRSLKNDRGAGG
jgi:hypothetical protein